MDSTDILNREEVRTVLDDLKRRLKRSLNSRQNLIIFRLSGCCGLRRKEISGLNVDDFAGISGAKPALRVRKENTKGREGKRKARLVPLWWDKGTFDDLDAWLNYRREECGANSGDPFVCGLSAGTTGQRLAEDLVAKRWHTAIKVLGKDRVRQLSIHSGRHSFCSHALSIGRSLVEVRDAAGHANVSTTSIYLHFIERTGIADLFSFVDKETNDGIER